MRKYLRVIILLFCFVSTGCSRHQKPPEPPKCRVVTEIVIRADNVPVPGQNRYTDPQKMIKALNCLRRLDPWELPDSNPEEETGPRYRITLAFSDGSSKTYDLIGHIYFRENGGPWFVISAVHGLRIPLLLAAVPSDAI